MLALVDVDLREGNRSARSRTGALLGGASSAEHHRRRLRRRQQPEASDSRAAPGYAARDASAGQGAGCEGRGPLHVGWRDAQVADAVTLGEEEEWEEGRGTADVSRSP